MPSSRLIRFGSPDAAFDGRRLGGEAPGHPGRLGRRGRREIGRLLGRVDDLDGRLRRARGSRRRLRFRRGIRRPLALHRGVILRPAEHPGDGDQGPGAEREQDDGGRDLGPRDRLGARGRGCRRGRTGRRADGLAERLGELAGGLGTPGGILLEALHDDPLDRGGELGRRVGLLELHRLGVEVRGQQRHLVAAEREGAGQEVVEHHARGIDVAPRVDLLLLVSPFEAAADLLGAHVGRGPDDVLDAGQLLAALVLDHLGDAEVEHLELDLAGRLRLRSAPLGEHQVRGLEVAVDDRLGLAGLLVAVAVRLLEHGAELVEDPSHAVDRQGLARALLEDLFQAPAADELHLDVAHRVGAAEVVDGHGARMIELGHQPGLALEPRPALVVLGDLGLDQLQRAGAVQLDVLDLPDLAHAPDADLLEEPVLAEDDSARLEDRRGEFVPVARGAVGLGRVRVAGVLGRQGRGRVRAAGRLALGRLWRDHSFVGARIRFSAHRGSPV